MDRDSFSHDRDILDILKGVESQKAEYPHELLAARRKLFLEQVEKQAQFGSARGAVEKDQKLFSIFRNLKSVEPQYPPHMFARRRTLYNQRIAETIRGSIWHVLHSLLSNNFAGWLFSTSGKFVRASALALGFVMAAFVAYALYGSATLPANHSLPQNEIFTPTSLPVTSTAQAVIIICTNGYEPPLCLSNEFDNRQDLTNPGNGKARPAVAKDSFSGSGRVHPAAHVNDGLYGPEASWVSNSPNSWIKIDLGTTAAVNTVAFGRDRLGSLNDGDPGRFLIAVAISDDVYADGNSTNDEVEYVQVYDSDEAGFNGKISGAETIIALFDLKRVRFIKITFENAHTAVDEVEAFVTDPSVVAVAPTKEAPKENSHPDASTPLVIFTPLPTDTATAVPIDTLPPTETVTPIPTDPPTPVETPTPIDTPIPIDPTVPPEVDTPIPSYTPISEPTEEPAPTDGPIEPVDDDRIDPIREGP